MNLQECSLAVRRCIELRESCYISGPSGIGKTEMMFQLAESLGMDLIHYLLVYRDTVDVRGLPVPDFEDGTTRNLPPVELKFRGRPKLIFVDELPSAPTSVQAAMYQAFNERSFGENKMRDCDAIVGAGNRTSDRGVVNRIPMPLKRRWFEFEVEPSVDAWSAWANTHDVGPLTIAFIRNFPHLFYSHEPDQLNSDPRAWVKVDNLMKSHEDSPLPIPVLNAMIAGKVGDGAATEYIAYTQLYLSLPSLDSIIADPLKVKVRMDAAVLYAITAGLSRRMTAKNLSPILKFLDRIPTEYTVMCLKDAFARDSSIPRLAGGYNADYRNWAAKHKDVLGI